MRIEDNSNKGTVFDDIKYGECFKWEGRLYVKCGMVQKTYDGSYITCFELSGGVPASLGCATEVEEVSAKVVIE